MSLSTRLRFLLFFTILSIYFTPLSFSQTFQNTDTLRINAAQGAPGDTALVISVFLHSTIDYAGFTLQIVYDSTVLSPNPRKFLQPARVANLDKFDGNFSVPGIITFIGIDLFGRDLIFAGDGSILDLLMDVKPQAAIGKTSELIFFDDPNPPVYDNSLSDFSGTNFYIPQLKNGSFTVTGIDNPGNDPPLISSFSRQELQVYETLHLEVIATDPEGGFLELFAQDLPRNSFFNAVSGFSPLISEFSFTPDINQADSSYLIKFIVRDDSSQTVSALNVTVEGDLVSVPTNFTLFQNYPNPFNISTNFSYFLEEPGSVKLTVFDAQGRKITDLVNGLQNPGYKTFLWRANDTNQNSLPSGTYFYRLEFNGQTQTKKMVIVK